MGTGYLDYMLGCDRWRCIRRTGGNLPFLISAAEARASLFDSVAAMDKDWLNGRERAKISLSPKIRRLVQRFILGAEATPFSPSADSPFPGFKTLQRSLNPAIGKAASNSLFSRALSLSKAEFPRLAGLTLNKTGGVEGLANIDPPLTREEIQEAELLLTGNAIALLCLFLGEAMTLRLLQDEWPDASFAEPDSRKERTP